MSIVLRNQGELEESFTMHQKALGIRLQALGPNHIDTAASYFNMAVILYKQDRLEQASIMGPSAVEHFLQILGPDHPYAACGLELMKSINGRKSEKGARASEGFARVQLQGWGEHSGTLCINLCA